MRIYEDPQMTSENRLPPRSYYIPGGKSEYTLLNGEWRFAYFGRDIDVPETITQWDTIPVPSCWQLQGYGHPNYTNWSYPFPVDPPYVPDDNPCGVYEREFTLKQKWGRVDITLNGRVRDNAAWLPRLGFELELPQASSEFTYYGRGPQENYCDLYHAALVGLYRSDAGKEYVPYVRPQEHGNHTGVKRLAIGGLCFSSQQGFECCVSNYSTAALTAAQHTDELVQDGKVHLRVDYRVSGVGSNACGPELEPKYRLAEKEIHFTVTMQPRSY